jgi:GH24 family phage-related lysozyme (muramidase)
MAYLHDSLSHLEIFEGIVPWMYLDTRGFVTVGVGEMLATPDRAQSLGFLDEKAQPTTPEAILTEYHRVTALPHGRLAGFYRSPTSPTLPHPAIDALLMQHLDFFDGQLSQHFPNYPGFPDPVKLGLLDMVFNLGVTGLLHGYPHFMTHVRNQDWANAAVHCHRNGPSHARNDWTRQQFLAAAAFAARVSS